MQEAYRYKPFSLLTEEQFAGVASHLYRETAKKGAVLLTQELTNVDRFRVLTSGAARFYFEFNFSETLKRNLREGDSFGGISILLNEGIATKTLRIQEDAEMIVLDADHFLFLCEQSEPFTEFFTNAFGKSMINRTYAGIISRQVKDKELNLPFFNQPIAAMYRPIIAACPESTPIRAAAQMMAEKNSSALLVNDDRHEVAGIVTDADLRKKVLAQGLDPGLPVRAIMSSPVTAISDQSLVYQAFLEMIEQDVRHLMLLDQQGAVSGILTEKDLIVAQTRSTYLLIKTVKAAKNIRQLKNIHDRLIRMLLTPIQNGASTEYITKLITAFSDAIIDKSVTFAIDEIGPPPCPFVFMVMGSEGREEQTFISDQDNALIYQDQPEESAEAAEAYFQNLSARICDQLHSAGYRLCTGDNMAKNEKWCQPLSVWKEYFLSWIRTANPQDLLHSSIFFDFRGVWGELSLAAELKDYLLKSIDRWPGFLRNLTENTLFFKPPVNFFGKLLVEKKGEHKGTFDIKLAILPIIDFARIYALKHKLTETNTLRRLFRLHKAGVFSDKDYRDLIQTYNYLMRLRFLNQITVIIDEQKEPDNHVDPTRLSSLDRALLKTAFQRIATFQQKLNFDFTGTL